MKYFGIMVDTKMDFFGEIRHTIDKAMFTKGTREIARAYVEIFWIKRW